MSRLDSFIRRMVAQRACLSYAAELMGAIGGPVLELGLGNGRTYDHLRELFPEREIYVFERHVAAHPDCIPDKDHLFEGDVKETLPSARSYIGVPAALIHCDIGSGNEITNKELAIFLGPIIEKMLAKGGIVVSDQFLNMKGHSELPLPNGIQEDRYFMYRK